MEPKMDDLAFEPAMSLAARIRARDVSAVELLGIYLKRVEKYNPRLNAVIHLQADKAYERACAADLALARGEHCGPLHGVPMTIKESFDWLGSPATRGHPAYRENYPKQDAATVTRLQQAGAIIFGKTNVPLMLQDWQTFNEIYGTTSNPWDMNRVPGGSSGGSAAALAAGLTALELGSDIGASIRNPAHYCGVFGHKPTYGIVPWQGAQLPDSHAPSDLVVFGPLARSAADLDAALQVLAGPTEPDASGWSLTLPVARKRHPRQFKVAVMLASPVCAQDDELTHRLEAAVEALARAGVTVDDQARPAIDLHHAHHIYLMMLRAATGVRVTDDQYKRHLEADASRPMADWSYRAYVDRATTISHRDWWQLHNARESMRLMWAEFFLEYDLLLCPAAASAAFPHDHAGERPDRTILVNGRKEPVTDQLFWAGLSSLPNLPATVAPVGLTKSGLPAGIQIIGPHLQDRTCIQFAALVEQLLDGFRRPPGF
jgi:amidase